MDERGNPQIMDAMTKELANTFLQSNKYTVLDFKLKKISTGAYKGNKMGMFLLKHQGCDDLAVCAHVHFKEGTSKVGRVNLLHHKKSMGNGCLEFKEEVQLKRNKHKVPVATVPIKKDPRQDKPADWFYWEWQLRPEQFDEVINKNQLQLDEDEKNNVKCAMTLVKECHDFVEKKMPAGYWDNEWEMEESYLNKFRRRWMDDYLIKVQDYEIPTVMSTH